METNLVLNHTLYIYNVDATEFGDATVNSEDANQVKCLLEDTSGWENDQVGDVISGNITCQISPTDAFYLERSGDLTGLLAQFNRFAEPGAEDWYRVASVRPGESLVDAEPDLVELTLTRIIEPLPQ